MCKMVGLAKRNKNVCLKSTNLFGLPDFKKNIFLPSSTDQLQ